MILYIEALEGKRATIGAQECDVLDGLKGESKKRELLDSRRNNQPGIDGAEAPV